MAAMDIRELRRRLGIMFRSDPRKMEAERERLEKLRADDPAHFEMYEHLFGAQWYRGGPVSKGELADMIEVSERTVERWEAGVSTPRRIARKAIEALGGQ